MDILDKIEENQNNVDLDDSRIRNIIQSIHEAATQMDYSSFFNDSINNYITLDNSNVMSGIFTTGIQQTRYVQLTEQDYNNMLDRISSLENRVRTLEMEINNNGYD